MVCAIEADRVEMHLARPGCGGGKKQIVIETQGP